MNNRDYLFDEIFGYPELDAKTNYIDAKADLARALDISELETKTNYTDEKTNLDRALFPSELKTDFFDAKSVLNEIFGPPALETTKDFFDAKAVLDEMLGPVQDESRDNPLNNKEGLNEIVNPILSDEETACFILNNFLKQFETAFEKRSENKSDSYEELNQIFDVLLNKLYNSYKIFSNKEELNTIAQKIEKIITKYDCPVLFLILDPNALEGEDIDQEMESSAKIKIENFQRKGLVNIRTMDNCLVEHQLHPLLERVATKVTYIFHWSCHSSVPQVNHFTVLRDQGNNIINRIIPLFSDSEKSPRLKRFTLLGCETTKVSVNKTHLFLTDDIKKINTDTSAYFFVLSKQDSKNITANLYFVDADKIIRDVVTNYSLPKQDASYFKQVIPTLKSLPPTIYKNDSQFYGKKSLSTLKNLHFHIYEHSKKTIQSINNTNNYYLETLLAEEQVKNYLSGQSDSVEKKLVKQKIPSLGTFFKKIVNDEEAVKTDIALKSESILNKNRKDPIEVKAYAVPVIPMENSMVPMKVGSNITKAIIYKRVS
ncbi:MAG: hypothetical protein JO131_08275 [Gammaproteobacteria bacterium]|nr:hypothetical protein [Gammaproteobacteria bacterium]